MRALVWDGKDLALQARVTEPEASAGRAVVRVRLAGICSTDLQIFKGYMGFRGIPGHEFVGEVVEGPAEWRGQRVVGEINFACGTCEYCARALGRHCAQRKVMGILGADGSFAELLSVPAQNLHAVPEDVEDETAVFTEPLAAAFEILDQIQLDPGHEVLVMGDGKLGMLCAQVLKLTGARVTVLGKHRDKLALVKRTGVRTVLLEDWKPGLFDVVVEATGSASGFKLALSCVRPRGTLVLKSTMASDHNVSLAPLVINEITVIGSRCGLFPPALQALAEKSVSVTPLIERVYPLVEGLDAVAHAGRPGTRKILLRM
jgi:threonine dehydrogenase-like Zn-dependent dehydrogenase